MKLFPKGIEALTDATINYLSDTIKIAGHDAGTPDAAVKAITGATNATPIVITATAHGFANGDLVYIDEVGGNLAANGLFRIANIAANTFEIQVENPGSGALTNVAGSAAYTSGGYAVCLGPSAAGDNWDDFDGSEVGTSQTLASKTNSSGVLDAADPTWSSLTGATIEFFTIREDTGTASTSRMLHLITGKHIVVAAAAAAGSATVIAVEPLAGAIPSGAVLTFSDGKTATLSGAAAAGDRTIAVSALASSIVAGAQALAPTSVTAGLFGAAGGRFTPNGGNLTLNFSNGANKIVKV